MEKMTERKEMEQKKERKASTQFFLGAAVCMLPILLGLYFWDKLPAELPMKWYADGTTGQYMPKGVTVFGMPAALVVLHGLVIFGLHTDPKRRNMGGMLKRLFMVFCPLASLLFVSSSILWNVGYPISIDKLVPVFVGIVFLLVGNYMPKCRRNYTLGIKTPWTLHSDENWRRTHHIAAFLWIIGGVVMIAMAFAPRGAFMSLGVVLILGIAVVPYAYSYLLYRKGI